MDDLTYRKIKNYLRKEISKGNTSNIINRLLNLYYLNINNIPIAKEITKEEYEKTIESFPYYFKDVDKNKIIEIFNKEILPNNPLKVNYDIELYNYDIKDNNYLEISLNTFRPIYEEDWKRKTEEINGVEITRQYSFYADYLRYLLRYKKFPELDEFILFIFKRYKRPIHKDKINVYKNIEKSYKPVKEYILKNNLNFIDIKKILINSSSILNRKEIQNRI